MDRKNFTQLERFGLSSEMSELYVYLLQKGAQTALELSRGLGLPRTRVYRILDELADKSMVVVEQDSRGKRFAPAEPSLLLDILDRQVSELDQLKTLGAELVQNLEGLKVDPPVGTRVNYYEGEDGLKQVTWNSLRAENELLTYEVDDMSGFIENKKYAEKMRQRFVDRGIHIRQLTNLEKIEDYTDVTEMVTKYSTLKYIDPKVLKIDSEILLYNDVYAMYRFDHEKEDVFCVEVHNASLAAMQKQMFEVLWKQAKSFRILSDNGRAEVE